jgi:hypothetical protein
MKEPHPKRTKRLPWVYAWRHNHPSTRRAWKQYLDKLRSKGL